MAKRDNKTLGDLGEAMAAQYLQEQNYKIVERNYRWARGEIDIVAQKDDTLIFVEVKTARQNAFGPPEAWVNKRKQSQLGQVAMRYLQENEIQNMDCRFDVVALSRQGEDWQIQHIENAFWL
ncbi:YraN family protein [candidate division KSB1 bacterium]|nr:YraN family protein [candidate division KSB1 bacterium]NIR68651.1 YraN family protein [candidate division KSB1 bacterium]NIS27140.1 YraN family protein [candidate division KSB1 bacterium]NIT74026.1 YraN family protein [candidate division KSB1 bacterium]NIU27892.1 YraN family protein [candidate division KSB1 bacterium]